MDNEILDSIVELTRQRDLDSLECSLITTLIEIVPAQRISLHKLLIDDNNRQLIEVTHTIESEGSTRKINFDSQCDQKINLADEHMRQCLNNSINVKYEKDGSINLLSPITSGGKKTGILSINSNQDLSEHESLIEGIAKIYGNYLYILNESERDKLTGLFTRRTFDKKLSRMLKIQRDKQDEYKNSPDPEQKRKQKNTSHAWLVIADIDHFKAVNDNFGHLYGDEVILLISQKMKQCFRRTDLLFRFGGEEFVIVLEPVTAEDAGNVLENFRKTIEQHEFPQIGQVTISLGYAEIKETDFPPTILNLADKALYYAKEHGRNCVYNYELLVKQGELKDLKKSGAIDLF